jgi:hypothetical protein
MHLPHLVLVGCEVSASAQRKVIGVLPDGFGCLARQEASGW